MVEKKDPDLRGAQQRIRSYFPAGHLPLSWFQRVKGETSINGNRHSWGPNCGAYDHSFQNPPWMECYLRPPWTALWKENYTLKSQLLGFPPPPPQRNPHQLVFLPIHLFHCSQRNLYKTQNGRLFLKCTQLFIAFLLITRFLNMASMIILVCLGCRKKILQIGWHKQKKFIFAQCWRLDVQDQGASKVHFSLACRWLTSPHVLTWPFLCDMHPWCVSLLIKMPVLLD